MRRPMVIVVMLGMLLVTAMPVPADEPKAGGANAKVGGMPFQWKATSPSTHEGDRYDLTVTNTSDEVQEARVRTVIMDHRNHTNTDVIDEQVEIEPGAAFTVQEKAAAGAKGKGKGKVEKAEGHSHDEGFAALGDTARLAPLSLGVLSMTGLGLYTIRRRQTY